MFISIRRSVFYVINSAIARLWVRPLEDRAIPFLKKKQGWLPKRLLGWASWWASAGRVIVNEIKLLKKRWIGPDWSVTYIGNGESSELLCYHLFPNPPEEAESIRVFLWQVPALLRKHAGEGDLVVCELNKIIRLSPQGLELAFTNPDGVSQILHGIDRPLEEIMAEFQPDIRKRVRKLGSQGYSYEPTHSDAEFDMFYHRMYLPYIQTRFAGRNAAVRDFDFVHNFFERGVLILVKKNEEPIAGAVCHLIGDTCRAYHMGVLDGRVDLLKQGSNVALWWSVLLWGRQQGARHYNLGTSIAITANGVFTFKQHWGSRVYPDKNANFQRNFFGKELPARLRKHINGLGFITEEDGLFYQVLLHDPAEPPDEFALADQLHHLAKCGIAGMMSISVDGRRQLIPSEALRQDPTGRRYLEISPLIP